MAFGSVAFWKIGFFEVIWGLEIKNIKILSRIFSFLLVEFIEKVFRSPGMRER